MLDSLDAGQMIALGFLALLMLSFLGSLFGSRTQLRNASVWGLLFVGIFVAVNIWEDTTGQFETQASFVNGRIEVPKGPDNHFHLTLQVNGVDIDFLVDTGASQVVLSKADAARIGLDPDGLAYIGRAFTANGEVATAPVRLDRVVLGDIVDTRVRASVNDGEMNGSLLGMSYLSRFDSIEIRQDRLILNR